MIRLIRIFTVSLGAIAYLSSSVQAQTIIPAADGTATLVMPNGNTFNITGGTLSGDGRNLFHSFQEFGLSTQQIANFIANPTIQNILGRVVGGNPSLINGLIQVSGGQANLFLMNPSGMVFGPNASINVPASFAATTATGIGFGNGQFNAYGSNDYQSLLANPQTFVFQGIQPGAIINAGDLTVPEGQGISLVAGTVVNTGKITAPGGEITLAAVPGTSLVRISQAGQVLSLEVPLPTDAQGNAVPFNATDLPGLLTGSGLDTGLTVTPQGTVQITSTGTQIPTTPGTNIVAGQLSTATDSAAGLGGTIQITGTQVGLVGAKLDASGTQGGGKILVGGEYQGKGDLPTAQNTYVSGDSVLKANAINQGDGGEVIVWADGNTAFAGNIEAQGGSLGGDGGFVEVSGKENLTFQGQVNLQAPQGDLGTLLLDPENITVTSGSGLNDSQLPVILFDQGSGFDYTISQTALEALSGNTNIILEAANNITIEPLLGGILSFQPGTGSITFVADANNGGRGDFSMDTNNTIFAPGRNISIQGINLTVGQIVTSNFTNAGGNNLASVGGSVNLTATGAITTGVVETGGGNFNATGTNLNVAAIDTSTGTEGLDGGAIALTATGNIQTGNLLSYTIANRPGAASQGGDITLNAGGSIDTTVGTGVEVAQTSRLRRKWSYG